MSKKIFIISAAVFSLIVIVFVVQKFFFSKTEQPIGNQESISQESAPKEEKKEQQAGSLKKIIEGGSLGFALSEDKSKIIFLSGKNFLSINFDGEQKNSIGAYPFEEVVNVNWSSTANQSLVQTKDGFYLYNLNNDNAFKVKDGADVVTWDIFGDKIVYKFYNKDTNERSINIADMDGKNWKELAKIDYRMVDFQINPGSGIIGYYQSPDSFSNSVFQEVDFNGGSKRVIIENKYGADYLWSPNGKKLLVSAVTEKGGRDIKLGITNENGGEYRTLDFPTTVRKCVWSKDNVNVYCAMMNGIVEESIMPNDWQSNKFNATDTFWKVNTENGKKERILEVQEINAAVDGEKFFLDSDEKYLFFTDKKSGALFRIDL